ncbi:MAG: ATP-binding protein [Homoserinimonas sp.]
MRYRKAAAWGALVLLVVFGTGAALQSEIFQVARGLPDYGDIYDVPLWARLVANLAAAALICLGVWLLPVNPLRRAIWLTAILGAVTVAVLVRCALQLALGVYSVSLIDIALVDVGVGLLVGVFSLVGGVVLAEALKRVRAQEREASSQAVRASAALDALQVEELRVRRDVAEGLHGTVQQHLVLLGASVRGVISDLPIGAKVAQEDLRRLTEIQNKVDEIREYDVREMSQLLYPEGIDLGLTQAVRMMLRRVPSSIRVQTHIDETVSQYDDPEFGRVAQTVRLLAVRLLEEAVSNALRHGNASRIDVVLRMNDDQVLTILVDDDGTGVSAHTVLSGLERLRERLSRIGGHIHLEPGALNGARLVATIPL